MVRRVLLAALMTMLLEYVAFCYVHRDLLWFDAPAAAQASVAVTRATAEAALARQRLSRHHAEALAVATDRDGLRDLHTAALARIARDNPGDAGVLLRYAEALATQRRFDEAVQVFARVAEAR
jgi:Flp pilus assembly protein TadD